MSSYKSLSCNVILIYTCSVRKIISNLWKSAKLQTFSSNSVIDFPESIPETNRWRMQYYFRENSVFRPYLLITHLIYCIVFN